MKCLPMANIIGGPWHRHNLYAELVVSEIDELNCDFIPFAYDVVISLIAFADLDENRFNRTCSLNSATRSHRIIKSDNRRRYARRRRSIHNSHHHL